MNPTQITIRGKTYPSQTDAAVALGVSTSLVAYYKRRERLDCIGLSHVHDGGPEEITVRGTTYPSHADAAAALGVTVAAVSKAKARGRLDTLGKRKRRAADAVPENVIPFPGRTAAPATEMPASLNYVTTDLMETRIYSSLRSARRAEHSLQARGHGVELFGPEGPDAQYGLMITWRLGRARA